MTATPHPWDEERRFHPILIGTVDDDDPLVKLWTERQSSPTSEIGLFNEVLRAARCVIYLEDEEDGPSLEVVFYAVDLRSAEMVLARPLRLFGFENDDDLKGRLASVLLEELPLIAETEAAQARLDALIRDLVVNGFSSKVDGKLVKLKMTDKGRAIDLDNPQVKPLGDGRLVPTLSETRLAIRSLRDELDAHEAAARTLAALRLAIGELQEALGGDVEELVLQAVLTRHPVLFGPEYVRVVSQHRLGAEFVMDFALQRAGGWFELVEIERSTHALFKQRDGAPTAALIHAEQQVLDWLEWLERHGAYAREELPGLTRPQGWVVIGRSTQLSEEEQRRLVQRNAVFASTLHVLTWDQLLDRGRHLLAFLEGSPT